MSHDQFPQSAVTPEAQDDSLYSERPGFIPDEFTEDATPFVPVIRGDNTLDHGWMRIGMQDGKVVLQKGGAEKRVSPQRLQEAATQWDAMHPPRTPEALPVTVQADLGYEAVVAAHDEMDDCLTPDQARQLRAAIAAETAAEQVPSSPLDRFSEQDQKLLTSFAFYAMRKRDAQLHGEGSLSSEYSRDMGDLLKRMSQEARNAARNVATKLHGEGNVAF